MVFPLRSETNLQRRSTQNLPRRPLHSKWGMALGRRRNCNFIYAQQNITAFPEQILTKILITQSPKRNNKGNYGYKFIYASTYSVASIAPIFMKLVVVTSIVLDTSHEESHTSWTKNVENTGKILLVPLSGVRFGCTEFHDT